jgi:hypothetical protein
MHVGTVRFSAPAAIVEGIDNSFDRDTELLVWTVTMNITE